jgi:hypothetical protein
MFNHPFDPIRRYWLKVGTTALIAVPTVKLLVSGVAQAAQQPSVKGSSEISETDPQATALGYRHDATQVDPKYKRSADQVCANCQLYSGQPESKSGPCAIFSYRLDPESRQPYTVSAQGWCLSWGPRANTRG